MIFPSQELDNQRFNLFNLWLSPALFLRQSPSALVTSLYLLCRNSLVLKHQAEAFLHFETKRPALTFSDSRKTENRTSSCCVVWSSQQNQENHSNTQFRHSCYPLSPSATCPYPPVIARWVEQAKELLAGWRSSRTQQREHVPICPRPWMIKKKQEDSTQRSVPKDIEKYSNQSSLSSKCLKLYVFLVSSVFL